MPIKARLVLPTVETCHWRQIRDEQARCGIVAQAVGEQTANVPYQACKACCETFPPSPKQLNSVVASLLYNAAQRIKEAGGTPDCDVDLAEAVQQQAERQLNIAHDPRAVILPARESQDCCWLGGERQTLDPIAAQEKLFQCEHPKHETTTLAGCRLCRDWANRPSISSPLSACEIVPPPGKRSQQLIQRWAVGVTTAPRRSPTLEACLDSIVRAGWEDPWLFMDGTTHIPARYAHLRVVWRENSVGAWPAWYLGLAELVALQPEAEAYMMLQDDVVLFDRQSLKEYLTQVLWPENRAGLASLFFTGVTPRTGWAEAEGAWHFSAQGLILSAGAARALLVDPDMVRSFLAASSGRHVPIPEMIHAWSCRHDIPVWYPNPSLAQHIGNSSTIWMDARLEAGRRAAWYSGSLDAEPFVGESLADFPEDAFPCLAEFRQSYEQQIVRGRARMRQHSVVICGLARDARLMLPRSAARLEHLGSMFDDYRVVIVENDSQDGTRQFLNDWQDINSKLDVLSFQTGTSKFAQNRSLERAAWMGQCRNRYLDRIRERYSEFEYAIVLDMDLPGGWSYDGIAHTFGQSDWDFVGSYGIKQSWNEQTRSVEFLHFDVWAFRPARGTSARRLVDHSRLKLSRGGPWLPVESCFGGLGIYSMACMLEAAYGGADCEHVVFHNHLQQLGKQRLYMNPSQLVLYSPV